MFTGIIESLGTITDIQQEGSNYHLTIESSISDQLKIDQSVAHDGVCLTVVSLTANTHTVTAIKETLDLTTIGNWQVGQLVNLERAAQGMARLDGHIVQGHVDNTGTCLSVEQLDGSWIYTIQYPDDMTHLIVPKGSVCVNGVSLTVVEPRNNTFQLAIIPYTYEHTTFKQLQVGDAVNLEMDIIGKYIARYMEAWKPQILKS